MFPNIIQSDRKNSLLDDQLILYHKNIPNTPELNRRRIPKRLSSKIGSQSQISRKLIKKNKHYKLEEQTEQLILRVQLKLYHQHQLYQDLFFSESSDSNSSQELTQKCNNVQQKGASILNYDKVIDEQMDFIHKTLHQQLSSIRYCLIKITHYGSLHFSKNKPV